MSETNIHNYLEQTPTPEHPRVVRSHGDGTAELLTHIATVPIEDVVARARSRPIEEDKKDDRDA